MKYLSILRHGKSTDGLSSPAEDFRRPLTESGRKRVKRAARILGRMDPAVDLVVSSPAERAAQSATELCAQIGYEQRVLWQEGIYQGSAHDLLALLGQIPEEFEHVVLIGHNPGLEQLLSGLCAGITDRHIARLSTGALAHLHVELFRWKQIRWGCGNLHLLANTKYLRKRTAKNKTSPDDQDPTNTA